MKKKFLFVFLVITDVVVILFSNRVYALSEIGVNYGYDKKIYGDDRQNKSISRNYAGHWAWYLFETSALEFNYMYNEDLTIEHLDVDNTYEIAAVGFENKVISNVYGIGLRQALSSKQAAIRPLISLGYAKEFVKYNQDVTYRIIASGDEVTIDFREIKTRSDSVFASFILQIRLTSRFSLQGSVKSLFPAFEFSKAKDNLKYSAGLTFYL